MPGRLSGAPQAVAAAEANDAAGSFADAAAAGDEADSLLADAGDDVNSFLADAAVDAPFPFGAGAHWANAAAVELGPWADAAGDLADAAGAGLGPEDLADAGPCHLADAGVLGLHHESPPPWAGPAVVPGGAH